MLYKYRRLILIIGIALIAIISIWVTINYLNSQQKVTITFDTANVSKLELYKAYNTRNVVETNGNSLQTIESGKTYTLQKGLYALKPAGEHIKTNLIQLDVKDKEVKQTIDISYTDTYLSELLIKENASIQKAINTANPRITQLYNVTQGHLYHYGEWYGAVLAYTGTDSLSRDTLRFVMKKEGDTWKMISTIPEISLSAKKYKDVPIEVLKAINLINIGLPVITPKVQLGESHAD